MILTESFSALSGHPAIFLKIVNYSLFVASSSVKHYLFSKGVDPDTMYLNDLKFMKKVFKILVSFTNTLINTNYRLTSLGIDQQ